MQITGFVNGFSHLSAPLFIAVWKRMLTFVREREKGISKPGGERCRKEGNAQIHTVRRMNCGCGISVF